MIHNGANGYLLKNKGKEELINAIHQVAGGHRYLSLDLALKAIPKPKKKKAKLTDREFEILELVRKGLTDRAISIKLNISTATVETHCRNMRKKTNTHNRVQLLNYAADNDLL
jgi:DNA-binding NarL/FixJ family response regulator